MGGVGSGRRDSTPRRKSGASGAREWLRKLCADPKRREKVRKALDKALDEGNLGPWWTAFTQGHGNPPQALDVKIGGGKQPIRFVLPGFGCVPPESTSVPVAGDHKHGEE